MSNKHPRELFTEIIRSLLIEMELIEKERAAYGSKLPRSASIEFTADTETQKKYASAYYKYLLTLDRSLSKIEGELSKLYFIMTEADKAFCYDVISDCDTLLRRYEELKKGISEFTSSNERLICASKIVPSEMVRYLSMLGYKLKYFDEYLRTFDI